MVLGTAAIPFRFLRDESTTIYASSKLNRVGRRAARYDSGFRAHKYNRPAKTSTRDTGVYYASEHPVNSYLG